jgi:hypothetical protein
MTATTATFSQPGAYTLRLTASDSELTAYDDVTLQISSNSCATAPAGMIAWWTGDNHANDVVGGHHGTLQGGATFAGAIVNQGFHFDGVDDYVEVPDSDALKPANVTVEAWIKFDGLDSQTSGTAPVGDQYLVFKKNTRVGNHEGYALVKSRINGIDVFRFGIASAQGLQRVANSTNGIVTGRFYYVVGSYDGQYVRLYIDGVLVAEETATFPLDYGNRPVFIGTSGEEIHDGKLNGAIDEVALYNRALTASEILSIYQSGHQGKCESANVAPTVSAGPDQSLGILCSANLQGTVSDDGRPVGSTLGISWSKVSGPGSVTFADPNAAATTVTFSTAGDYMLRL